MAHQIQAALACKKASDEVRHRALTVLRLHAVKARVGLSRSTIYSRMEENAFPRPISLGGRAVGWVES